MSKSKYDFYHNLAIIIGINNYSNGIPELETPVADAEKLAKILQENYQYEVQILLNEQATLLQLTSLLADLKQKTLHLPDKTLQIEESDRLIFYFAGHGIVPADGLENRDNLAGYLVPQDARGDILLQKQIEINKILLPMPDLHDALVELPCRHLLVILDCCFAGAFRSSLYREILPARKVYKQRYDRFIRDRAWQAIASAAHDQKAIDYLGCFGQRGSTGKHSPFAEALFEGLLGAADTIGTGDGIITASELYCYVRDQVEELTDEFDKRQTPGLFPLRKHDKGEYIFLLPNFDQNKLENAPALNEENNPYRGLKSYEEEHSKLFFGRDELIKQLYERVHHSKNPLIVVLGVSGSGKSSLVKAGLIPYIRANHNEDWYIIPTFRPGESPFAALAEVIAVNTEISGSKIEVIKSLSETLIQAPRQFIEIVANGRQIPANAKLLLVIDQFEELITICKQQEREQFLNFLAQVLEANAQKLHIIITLRSDFEPRFLDSALKPYWSGNRFPVRAMRSDELRQAIERPASDRMLDFDPPNLVDLLIDEVGQMPGSLSLLSFTLSELYTKCIEQESRTLTQADYQELGGVAGSLTHRATQLYNKLDKAQQLTMQRVMLRMVIIEGGESARRRVPLSELIYINDTENERVEEIRQRLDKARLIVGGQEPGGEPYVEPAHDALVRGWSKLQEWKNDEQENLLLQQRITPAANDWDRNNRPDGLLLPDGDRLKHLITILQSGRYSFNSRETEFINISLHKAKVRQMREELPRKAARVLDLLSAQPTDGLVLAIQTMGQNLANMPNEVFGSVQSSLLSSVQIARERRVLQAHTSNVATVVVSQSTRTIVSGSLDKTLRLWDIQGNVIGKPLEGHENWVNSVAISQDGEWIVSSSRDNTIRLWAANGTYIRQILQAKDAGLFGIMAVAINTDGTIIVSGKDNGEIQLFNRQGQPITEPFQHGEGVRAIAFSPDGKTIASGSQDCTIRLWDLKGNPIGLPLVEHSEWVNSVAFSPEGSYIASASHDGTVCLWNKQGELVGSPLRGHGDIVTSVVFSPEGGTIASGSHDNTIRLWNLQGNPVGLSLKGSKSIEGPNFFVESLAFSPDEQTIISGHADGTVRLWDYPSDLVGKCFRGHQERICSVAISSEMKASSHRFEPYIISSGYDQTIRKWDLRGNLLCQPFQHESSVLSVAISPDGKHIASGSGDKMVRLWDCRGNLIGQPFCGHEYPVWAVTFSPDGQTIASGSRDGTVRLWDLQGNSIGQPFLGHEDSVWSIVFSSDGEMIVSGGLDGTVRLWNRQGKPLTKKPFEGHREAVTAVAIRFDGRVVVSSGRDNNIRLSDIQGNPIGQPFRHENWVTSVAISPDGQYIVSGSEDKTIRIWDLQGYLIGQPLRGHEKRVTSVAISHDGQYIISGSDDETVRLWQAGSWKSWLQTACHRLRYHPVFTNPESIKDPEQREIAISAYETCSTYVWSKENTSV